MSDDLDAMTVSVLKMIFGIFPRKKLLFLSMESGVYTNQIWALWENHGILETAD